MYQFKSLYVPSVLFSLLLYCCIQEGSCQDDCAQGFPDLADSQDQSSDSLTKQFVMPLYTFHCSAIITQWEAIVHVEKQSYTIQFQIWRWNHTVNGYQLVGSNEFHRIKQANSGLQKEVKQTYPVEPHAQLQVAAADIVGVFASDINVHYKASEIIDIYAAEQVDHPLVGIFAPLNLDPAFNRRIDGAPLIAVQTDTTNVVLRTPAFPQPETQPKGDIDATMAPSRTVLFLNETTVYHSGPTPLDSTTWTQHKELIIGVTICSVALILFSIGIIATITLYIRASRRKRIAGIEATDGTQTPRRSFFPFRKRPPSGSMSRDLLNGARSSGDVRGIHMTVLLTEAHSANTETDHSYAYINSELISSNPSRPLVRNSKPPALPPDRISVRQNPCYSATPAASTEDLRKSASEQRVENIYDLPMVFTQPRQAREYEVPIRSPSSKSKTIGKPQHIYEVTSDNNNVAIN